MYKRNVPFLSNSPARLVTSGSWIWVDLCTSCNWYPRFRHGSESDEGPATVWQASSEAMCIAYKLGQMQTW